MSFPIIIGNSAKDNENGTRIRNFSQTMKKNNKFTEWERKATDLLMELQKSKNQIAQLQKENISLKTVAEDLKKEHDNLKKTVEVNKAKIEKNLDELNVEITKKETDLKASEKKCAQQKEHYTKVIEELRKENKKLNHKIKNLEGEMDSLKLNRPMLQKQNEQCQQKLNVANEKELCSNDIQAKQETDSGTPIKPIKPTGCIPKIFKSNIESENLLLSDIFFKPRSFNENELIFFDSKPTL